MSIQKLKEGKYKIFISDGNNLDGSRRRFTKTITTDLKGRDLQIFLLLEEEAFEKEIKSNSNSFIQMSKGKFKDYADWWLNSYKKVRPKTQDGYKNLINGRINDYLGNLILNKITTFELVEFMNILENTTSDKTNKPLSPISINHYHTLLKIMFNDAVKLKIIKENPILSVKKAIVPDKIPDNFYDKEQISKLLELLPNEPVKYQLAIMLALSANARLGEVTGVRWKNLRTDIPIFRIEETNVVANNKTIISDAKNASSLRDIYYPESLIPIVKEHEQMELKKKEQLGDKWFYGESDHFEDFVFTQKDGKIMHKNTPSAWFTKFVKKNNLKKVNYHGLRHTGSTFLLSSNQIDIKNLSARLGHSRTSTTVDIYSHALKEVDRKAAEIFDDFIEENEKEKNSGTHTGTFRPNLRIVK